MTSLKLTNYYHCIHTEGVVAPNAPLVITL